MDKITVTLKLRTDVYTKMRAIAQEQRRSITGQIEYVLLQWLEQGGNKLTMIHNKNMGGENNGRL